MLTWFLNRIMQTHPEWTVEVAFNDLRGRVDGVTRIRWQDVEVVQNSHRSADFPPLSSDR